MPTAWGLNIDYFHLFSFILKIEDAKKDLTVHNRERIIKRKIPQ